MKKIIFLAVPVIILAFTACKKEHPALPKADPATTRIKSYNIKNAGATVNTIQLTYDAQGRRVKQAYTDGSYLTTTYAPDNVTVESFNAGGISQAKYLNHLNANGLIDYSFNASTPLVVTYQLYNTNSQLESEIIKNNGLVTNKSYHFYDNGGNKIKDSLLSLSGTSIRTYNYYTSVISTTENINYGFPVVGAGNRNSLKSTLVKNGVAADKTYSYTSPQLDAQGRVSKQSYTGNGETVDYEYTYY